MTAMKIKEPEPQFYRLEGVWLTETGMSLLRRISMSPLHKRRQRRSRLGMLCGDGGHDSMELKDGDGDEGKGGLTGVVKEKDEVGCPLILIYGQICIFPLMDKIAHNFHKVQISAQQTRSLLSAKTNCTKHWPHPDTPTDGAPETKPAEGEGEHAKKRRGRKKSKLEDMFPAYLQEAFFGKQLMDLSKKALLVTPGQRHHGAMGLLHPPLPHARGARPTAPDTVEVRERAMGAGMHLKQEGGEGSQAQVEGSVLSSAVKDQGSTDPQGSEKEKNEGLPEGMESQDSEQFFRKILGSSEGVSLGGSLQSSMRPILEGGKGEMNCSSLPQRSLLTGISLPSAGMMDSFPGLSQSPFFDMRERGGLFSPDGGEESPWRRAVL
ncbi:unnamed protein product [Oncorhynchus mykiss]|uniref:Uncharacterized protein n=1 Tax=Oncorhynchus mykiss TaxID=8022 RepID=A0A060XUD5_ONCMY|nr:unnamed protein product [Oncorhynchus mykiss]